MNIDKKIKELYYVLDNPKHNWNMAQSELKRISLLKGVQTNRRYVIDLLEREFHGERNISILDYGCGTGIYVIILLLMGYKRVNGVDVIPKFNNTVVSKLGYPDTTFSLVQDKLPYEDCTFDIVNSSLVLEHVHDLERYYSEAARVLKPGGVCFFNFPQRLEFYDSHSKTWLIHWFPEKIRLYLWDIFSRQGGAFLNDYLNLKTVYHHTKIAKKYFSVVEERTADRIRNINFINYKGNRKIRIIADEVMNMKYIGNAVCRLFSKFATVDLYLKK